MTAEETPVPAVTGQNSADATTRRLGAASRRYLEGMEYLVSVVQQISLARSLEALMAIVRQAARQLGSADGATFVLREGDRSYYADEDAIAPLWKGRRFPLNTCISGWAMLNRCAVAIEDIYADSRIPADAYRPTFVKSLVMVPIRTANPIGAIGCYWARHRRATDEEVRLLQALADCTSVAMENIRIHSDLDRRVGERTAELETALHELESFSYAVSHDLRAPLRSIEGFSSALLEDYAARLDESGRDYLDRVCSAAKRMNMLIEDLLRLSQVTRFEIERERVDLSAIARAAADEVTATYPQRQVRLAIRDGIRVYGGKRLLHILLRNLFDNAWKFTAKSADAVVEFGVLEQEADQRIYFVRDNGAGFNMAYADKLFAPFRRLHAESEFPGTGIGLATVQRIVKRHGGRIWAEAQPDKGAAFFWTLAEGESPPGEGA